MKVTDYCPRAAPFDSKLSGLGLIGVEVGVDVGAHAQALLEYCGIDSLTLVDPWPNPYCRGYCEGRLAALGFRPRFTMMQDTSVKAGAKFADESLDFIYIDQEHGGPSVTADLEAWWPKLKPGGILGYRNYTKSPTPLSEAVDAFVLGNHLVSEVLSGEIAITKL